MITDDTLKRIMPNLPQEKRARYLPHLQQAMDEFGINVPLREAAFLAQIAHESSEFRFMEEIWGPTEQQRRYEPPSELAQKLGNMEVGDGKVFKGRGPIQITGRANYARYGELLAIDLVNDPPMAGSPEVAFRIAGLYWQKNGLNELADQQLFETITKRINGGLNGLEDRSKFYNVARNVLGVGAVRGIASMPKDTGDDSAIPRFSRGLDSSGEVTLTAAERSAAKEDKSIGIGKPAAATARKSAVKKDAKVGTGKALAKEKATISAKGRVSKREVRVDAKKVVERRLAKRAKKSRKRRKL